MKDNETANILFQYLKDVLYDPNHAQLDVKSLPKEFQKVGETLEFLAGCLNEERDFATALANGEIYVAPPQVDNVLAEPLKELQSGFRKVIWQTRQISQGDYGERINFMGEFSEAFNDIVFQLKERAEELDKQRAAINRKNEEQKRNFEVLSILAERINAMAIATSTSEEIVFTNAKAKEYESQNPEGFTELKEKLLTFNLGKNDIGKELSVKLGTGAAFKVEPFVCSRESKDVLVFIISEK